MPETEDSYKKVLLVTGFNLSGSSATDITLRSYFNEWPKSRMLILTTEKTKAQYAKTIIISPRILEVLRKTAQYLLLRKGKGIDNRNLIPAAVINDENNVTSIKRRVFTLGAAYADLVSFNLFKKKIYKEVDDFNPEVIYTVMGSIRLLRLAVTFSRRYKISIVPHFMDDWISTIYTGSFLLGIPRKFLLINLNKLLQYSKTGFCISEKMCREYATKFQKEFRPLMNTVSFQDLPEHRFCKGNTRDLVFTYFGGLHLNRWKVLAILSDVLLSLSDETGGKYLLKIYTSGSDIVKYASQFKNKNVIINNSIGHKEALSEMKNTDRLVHIEAFDKSVTRYTRLSISTKIPEYLSSGTPVIAIGPSDIASIEYLKENECAYVASGNDFGTIKEVLRSAVTGSDNSKYVTNGFELVKKNHSFSQTELLKNTLSETAAAKIVPKPILKLKTRFIL